MASVTVHCPRCQSAQVYRHGQNPNGHDRFRCRDCHRVFQLTYAYEARKPGVKEQITEMVFNGAGVRDTARTLRTRLKRLTRKTICFSRSVEIHEKVIGAFSEKKMFY